MGFTASEVQRRPVVLIFHINASSMLLQLLDNLNVSMVAGLVKRRQAVTILGVHVSSNTHKPSNFCWVVSPSHHDQFIINNPIHASFLSIDIDRSMEVGRTGLRY
jgi:hypothetical protein